MKKQFVILAFVLLGSGAFAQNFRYGIKAGLNIANLKATAGGASATSPDLTSFHAGFYGVLMTSEKFGFQPEIIYSGQGSGSSGGSGSFNLNYLNIPVMMRLDLSPGVNFQAGPQVGFLLNATVDGIDAKSAMNSIEFGLGFGLGIERPSGFMFGFRYNLGLSNTLSSSTSSALSGIGLGSVTMTNQVLQFSLGHTLGKKQEKE